MDDGEQHEPALSHLYRDDEVYLSSHEVILRISPSFRRVVLDRVRGKAEYLKEWDRLTRLNAPQVILQRFSREDDRTVWVSLSDDEGPDSGVTFVLWPRGEIWIEHDSASTRERVWPTITKLAELLGYVAWRDAGEQGRAI